MRLRLPVLFLLLVVLPTALLSLMAGMSFRNWEAILQRRLEASAVSAIDAVSVRLDAALERNLDEISAACADAISRGGKSSDYDMVAIRLHSTHPLTKQMYMFLNPWGLLWPEAAQPAPAGSHQDGSAHWDSLTEALRREIASGSARIVRFSADDSSYLFRRQTDHPNLYAGFEVDAQAFSALLSEALTHASTGGLLLQSDGFGLGGKPASEAGGDTVFVSDSFHGRIEAGETMSDGRWRLLVQSRLKRPFDFVRIRAYLTDPAETRLREASRARLYGWGIVLLAGGIVIGALYVLRQAAVAIQEARKRSEFVMSVSHDLRTPVASMKMLAESLFFDTVTDPDKRKKFLATIIRESERLNQLVERVLFLVRFGQNALVYSIRRLDPAALTTETVNSFNARFADVSSSQNPSVRVELFVQPDLPSVQGDRTALTQLLLNLLDNAYKYSRKRVAAREAGVAEGASANAGEPSAIRIDVAARRVQKATIWNVRDYVGIAVKDYGMGMERRELHRIFRRFYRVDSTARDHVVGVGLGLAMCRHVASAHNGWIDVESEPGKGSTFTLFLPVGEGE